MKTAKCYFVFKEPELVAGIPRSGTVKDDNINSVYDILKPNKSYNKML